MTKKTSFTIYRKPIIMNLYFLIFSFCIIPLLNTYSKYHISLILDMSLLKEFETRKKKLTNEEILKKISKCDFQGDLYVSGIIYTSKGITVNGVIASNYGIKISNGGASINGDFSVNQLSGAPITLGNYLNGKNINLRTGQDSHIRLESNAIQVKSPFVSIPRLGVTLPLVIDDQGRLKTLYSTKKMKKNIQPLLFTLEDLKYLQPSQFNYTEESGLAGGQEWGFIAEDLMETPLEPLVIMDSENNPLNIDDRKLITFLCCQLQNMCKKIQLLEDKLNKYEEIESLEFDDFFEL